MSTQDGMHTGIAAGARARWATRVVAAGAVAAAFLVAAPATASASPRDTQILKAQIGRAQAAKQVGTMSAQLATAQASLDAARASSNIALDTFEGKQAEYEDAQAAATKAEAAATKAQADLGNAKDAVASFARDSYMQGSTTPAFSALMSADGPSQLLERKALLETVGSHRNDVLVQVTVVEHKAAASKVAAAAALTHAGVLKKQAAAALATASSIEAGARRQAAVVALQRSRLQRQLNSVQGTLVSLEGARTSEQQAAARQAAAEAAAAEAASEEAAAEAPVSQPVDNNPPAPPVPSDPTAGPGSASAADTAIAAAKRWIGTRYAWGGGSLTGPSEGWGIDAGVIGFDCSGLTRYAYAQAGIYIPRNSSAQYAALAKVSGSNLQPGDLVFYATDTSRPSTIHHVAMYLGGQMMIEAPESGLTVRITGMRWGGFIGAVRPSA